MEKILTRFEMSDCNGKDSPLNTSGDSSAVYLPPNPVPVEEMDASIGKEYRSVVGAIIYPAVLTRVDLAYPASYLGQFICLIHHTYILQPLTGY